MMVFRSRVGPAHCAPRRGGTCHAQQGDVAGHHFGAQLLKGVAWRPTEDFFCLGGISDEQVDLGGPKPGVHRYQTAPVLRSAFSSAPPLPFQADADLLERHLNKRADGGSSSGGT